MSLQHGDKLFVFYDRNELPKHGRYSYFGNFFGTVTGFNQYIEGYIFAVKALYDEYISCDSSRIDILDTLIYPLCFNYRHIVELYIKYLYFKFSGTNDADKKNFVNNVRHNLNSAWSTVKPCLIPLLSKINSSIDLTLFDEFVCEIDRFDTSSFRMRYPVDRSLNPVHSKSVKLDVVGLHSKMLDLFDSFCNLDYELDNVLIKNDFDVDLINSFKIMLNKNHSEIIEVAKELRNLTDREDTRLKLPQTESVIDFSEIDICNDPETQIFEKNVLALSPESGCILGLLIQIGRSIVDGSCKLAVNEERTNDFSKLIEITYKENETLFSFDNYCSIREMCYPLFEKRHAIVSKWLEASLNEIAIM